MVTNCSPAPATYIPVGIISMHASSIRLSVCSAAATVLSNTQRRVWIEERAMRRTVHARVARAGQQPRPIPHVRGGCCRRERYTATPASTATDNAPVCIIVEGFALYGKHRSGAHAIRARWSWVSLCVVSPRWDWEMHSVPWRRLSGATGLNACCVARAGQKPCPIPACPRS